MQLPSNLIEAVRQFSDPERCLEILIPLRWPDGITCFHCKSKEAHYYLKTRKLWKCKSCRKQFSLKKGSVFEDSQLSLDKWLVVMWQMVMCKNGVSSYEVSRAIGVTQKTAWYMEHRIRFAIHQGTFEKQLEGIVEADETYIGGKARNMHKGKRDERIKGRGTTGKAIVMGLLERDGEIRTMILKDIKRETLKEKVDLHVKPGSELHTDALESYKGLEKDYLHQFVNHAEKYVEGHVHNNGVENYWSLLKRSIKGTYVSVEPFHLFRYLDEQAFRFNNRQLSDQELFMKLAGAIGDKRLPHASLIGESEGSRRGRKKSTNQNNGKRTERPEET